MKNSKPTKHGVCVTLVLTAFLLGGPAVWAQYTEASWTVDGGGGTSTDGQYAVTDTIGQPATETMSDYCLTVAGGFWSVEAALNGNHTPTARDFSLGTHIDTTTSIPVARLLLLANDPDADPLTVTVTAPAHGSASVVGAAVVYAPASGYSGPDAFDYIVADPCGAAAIGVITVTVYPGQGGPSLISVNAVMGVVTVRTAGIPGTTYRLQYTIDLANPTWSDLPGSDAVTSSTGICTLTDSGPSGPQRFYRAVYVSGP